MARNLCFLVFMSLAVLATAENEGTWLFSSLNKVPASPPAPIDPCATIVYDMMDCMDFLTLVQPTNKPSASCCTGFKSVLAVSPLCVCAAVKTAGDIGLDLNMTRAAKLPALCGATSFDNRLCEANASPPHGSSTTPPPPPPAKKSPPAKAPPTKAPAAKAPSAATAAQSVSGSYSVNTASSMFVGVVVFMVSIYLA